MHAYGIVAHDLHAIDDIAERRREVALGTHDEPGEVAPSQRVGLTGRHGGAWPFRVEVRFDEERCVAHGEQAS